ncbi:hypothetical protein [Roseibium sp.]|uniref:hypothetical protein n=1 Tax=Roseibium sp. TaxID=1936156 RepID=UPI0032630643
MRMNTLMPARKVNAAAIGGALAVLVIWGIRSAWPELDIPQPVEAAITALIVFAAGYITPPSPADEIVSSDPLPQP